MNASHSITIHDTIFHLIYADLLPPLTETEYTALRDSIQQHGIRKAVHVRPRDDGSLDVLDGQHRLKIAAELGLALDAVPLKHEAVDDDTAETLALSLNLDRRHLTPEQRREYAAQLRHKGQSLRTIADTLHVSPATVKRDLDAAGVAGETPGRVTGADGKQYPAAAPRTPAARNGERILALFASPESRLAIAQICEKLGLQPRDTIAAVNLLVADRQLVRYTEGFGLPLAREVFAAIKTAMLDHIGYQSEIAPVADVIAAAQRATGADEDTIQHVLQALRQTREIESDGGSGLMRGRWWFDETEPTVEEYERRIVEVLSRRPLTSVLRLIKTIGHRARFKARHHNAAIKNLLARGVIVETNDPSGLHPGYALVDVEHDESASAPAVTDTPDQPADTTDYQALIIDILRAHGPVRLVELMRLARQQTGNYFIGQAITRARDDLLQRGEIVLDGENRYCLKDETPPAASAGTPGGEYEDGETRDGLDRREGSDAQPEDPQSEDTPPAENLTGDPALTPRFAVGQLVYWRQAERGPNGIEAIGTATYTPVRITDYDGKRVKVKTPRGHAQLSPRSLHRFDTREIERHLYAEIDPNRVVADRTVGCEPHDHDAIRAYTLIIARGLRDAGRWDGDTPLIINDVFALMHRLLSGGSIADFVEGEDYAFTDIKTLANIPRQAARAHTLTEDLAALRDEIARVTQQAVEMAQAHSFAPHHTDAIRDAVGATVSALNAAESDLVALLARLDETREAAAREAEAAHV